ncbi:hypothetical protein WR25_24489 [Diploscapter pachys]|uniref:Uncharacterized protein n=1 Tax=Diploscapter pachys TaxID=2018661 RepID=A0A2A2M373_9BILA|nr:hypothetical protein WR25_24489 [Diploscapter pachys]
MLQRLFAGFVALDAVAREFLDRLGQHRQRLGTELTRLALQRVRRNHHRGGGLRAHRLFDRRHRFHAVFAEIAQYAHEAGAQFGARLGERRPIHQRAAFERHGLLPSGSGQPY